MPGAKNNMNNAAYQKLLRDTSDEISVIKSGGIYKYEFDDLNYHIRTLDNGLRVLFIEDELATKSYTSMNVSIGSDANSPEFPGLAHFLEHMLFIGSKKYPSSNHYSNTVTEGQGTTNAYTSSDHTHYYFSCKHRMLYTILDIFCNFFVEPLLDPKYIEKEASAVDAEHQKNLSSNSWRIDRLYNYVFLKNDPVRSGFSTGNKETLLSKGNQKIIKKLREFYNKYYTTDRMVLTIVHNRIDSEFIDIIDNIFSDIPKKKHHDVQYNPIALPNTPNGTYDFLQVKNSCEGTDLGLRMYLRESNKNTYVTTKSYGVLNYLISHRSDNGLYAILTKTGLITYMESYISASYFHDTIMDIHFGLTQYGIDNRESIIMLVLAYLSHFRDNAMQYFDTHFDNICDLDRVALITQTRVPGRTMANHMIGIMNSFGTDLKYCAIHDLLYDTASMRKHFISLVNDMCKEYSKRMKVILLVDHSQLSDDHPLKNTVYKKTEPYYGIQYLTQNIKLNSRSLKKFSKLSFRMIELNSYIPKKLEIISPISRSKRMEKLGYNDAHDISFDKHERTGFKEIDEPNEFLRLSSKNHYYLLKQNDYETYYATVCFKIELESFAESLDPVAVMALEFYFALLYDANRAKNFMVGVAGHNVREYFNVVDRSIVIIIKSYDSNITDILRDLLDSYYTNELEIDPTAYRRIYTNTRDSINQLEKSQPFTRLHTILEETVNLHNVITTNQYKDILQTFDPELMEDADREYNYSNLHSKCRALLERGSIRGVMGGAIRLKTAQNIVKMLDSYIEYSKSYREIPIDPPLYSSDKSGETYNEVNIVIKNHNITDRNIGLLYAVYLGTYRHNQYDPKNNYAHLREQMAMNVLNSYIYDEFFTTMRTENEMGYYISASVLPIMNPGSVDLFLCFELQTQNADAENIVRSYVDTEFPDIAKNFDQDRLHGVLESWIAGMFEEYVNLEAKIRHAFGLMYDMSYERLDAIGDTTFINRLEDLPKYNELLKLKPQYIHDLYNKALRSHPRYIIKIIPIDEDDRNKN